MHTPGSFNILSHFRERTVSLGKTQEKEKKKASTGKTVKSTSFFGILENAQQEKELSLDECWDEICSLGEEVAQNPHLEVMRDYRNKMSLFLKQILEEGFSLTQKEGIFRKNFQRNRYTLVSVVNQEIENLMVALLLNQGKQINWLAKIEYIQGLVVDFFS